MTLQQGNQGSLQPFPNLFDSVIFFFLSKIIKIVRCPECCLGNGVRLPFYPINPKFPAKAQNDRSFLFLLSGPKLPSVPGFLQSPLDYGSLPCPGHPERNAGPAAAAQAQAHTLHSSTAALNSPPRPPPPAPVCNYKVWVQLFTVLPNHPAHK